MTKLRDEHQHYAARLWREGAATSEIADALAWEFGIHVHRQAVQKLAQNNRAEFPERTRAQKRHMISRAMQGMKWHQEKWPW